MQPDVAGDERIELSDRVHVLAGVREVGALAAVDPTAIDEQRLVAIVERRPLDRVLLEVELGNTPSGSSAPVAQLDGYRECDGASGVHWATVAR